MATAADLQKTLDSLGLGFLFDVLNGLVKDPSIDAADSDAVAKYIETDTASQKAIEQRFIGNKYRVDNGLKALKPSEYIDLEQRYLARLKDNGMPVGFYDSQTDLAKLIGGDVSPVEFDARIQRGYQAAMNAPQSVKQQLNTLYGVTESDLAAYYLDPTKTEDILGRKKSSNLFARQLEAANIASQAQAQANINLGAMTAEELAAQGIDTATAQQGFADIGTSQEVFAPTTAEAAAGVQGITQAEQIAGTFGTNAAARKKISERRRKRTAAFEAGGGLTTTQEGMTGLRTVGQ